MLEKRYLKLTFLRSLELVSSLIFALELNALDDVCGVMTASYRLLGAEIFSTGQSRDSQVCESLSQPLFMITDPL